VKVLFYNHTGTVSGAERVLLMILARLDRLRFEPVVVCPENSRLMEMTTDLGVRTLGLGALEARFTWRIDRLLRYLFSFSRVIRNARKVIKHEAPDAIHANSVRAGLVMSAATMGLRVSVIWHAHDVLPRHPFSTAIRFFACASRRNSILAVSQAAADRFRGTLMRWFPKRVPMTIIHNAVDLERFQPEFESRNEMRRTLGLTEGQRVIGIVGHLTPNKGQLELVEAFATVSGQLSDAVLLIVGESLFNPDGNYLKSLMRAATSLAITDRIRFLGQRDDMPALMRSFDLLVVNSRSEACPLTVLEGLASGTPVVATAVGGTTEMISDTENGWLIKTGDRDALVKGMLTLLCDPDLRQRLGKQGRSDAIARFSIDRFIAQIVSLYRAIEERSATPQRKTTQSFEVKLSAD
jgi:glycosyltransferase involved in cell wall biosynthesis